MRLMAALMAALALTVTGFVRDGAAEIIFPQAIRFSVDLAIPLADIRSAELTLEWDDHDPVVVLVGTGNWYSAVDTETGALLDYILSIPVDDPPPLFSEVRYRWSFEAADGSSGTLEDTFIFQDPRIDWLVTASESRFSIAAPRSLSALVNALDEVHGLLEANTGRRVQAHGLVYPFDPGCTPGDDTGTTIARGQSGTTVVCEDGIADAVLAGYELLFLQPDATPEELVIGWLARRAYAPLWAGKTVPDWFSAGLAQFYAPTPKNALLPPAQQAARDGRVLSLDEMRNEAQTVLWRAQSLGMILYIADRIGYAGLYDLARVDGDDFASAYERAMDEPLSALIPAWQQWIFTGNAEAGYGITPYQPPTPLPTDTPTASTTPTATSTPSMTPTATPTATATPRGAATLVPAPTVTPSMTLTPLPPSVTPRPPGSLPTITPPPTALQTAVAQPGVQAGAVALLIVVLGVLIFLFIRLGNRR